MIVGNRRRRREWEEVPPLKRGRVEGAGGFERSQILKKAPEKHDESFYLFAVRNDKRRKICGTSGGNRPMKRRYAAIKTRTPKGARVLDVSRETAKS